MGHLPLPASKGPGHQLPVPLPTPRDRIPQLEPVAVIASLRESLAAAARPPETIFRSITDAAQTLTGAEGVALALRTGEVVLCRARSGDLAPEIGDKVDAGSGISGECLRTSKALRCDDTQTDDRVDPEVCRNVGIRSIAVVPLRGRDATIGILEAFSPRPHAFGGEQMSLLKRLAEVAQAAYEAEHGTRELPSALQVETISRSWIRRDLFRAPARDPLTAAAVTSNEERFSAWFPGARHPTARHYWIAGGAVLLLLVSAVIWTTWHEPDEDGPSPQRALQPQSISGEAARATAPTINPWKPAAGRSGSRTSQSPRSQVQLGQDSAMPALENAAEIETEKRGSAGPDRSVSGDAAAVAGQPDSSPQENSDPPLVVEMPPAGSLLPSEALSKLASTPTKLPDSEISVSQGVIDAALVRKVQPIYPAEARSKRMEGSVILELTIGEDGSTRDLKVVSGPPVLAGAAAEAVRQWRYRPALLNGKPIVAQKQVTVIFRAP